MAVPPSEIHVGEQGRIVIPANIRRMLEITPGSSLIASVHDNQIVLEKREAILKRIQSRFAEIDPDISLVDELIAERRAEAANE